MTEYHLVMDGLCKRFGKVQAVDHISAKIPKGAIYGFLGPNGAGKTTTIRMVMSILFPDAGRLEVLGHPNPVAVKDRLGYLPEEKGLYKKMKAAEVIAYFGRLKGLHAKIAHERAVTMLQQHGLGASVDQKCENLSKGMSQKVQILATLIHQPDLVILDEPFSGLDPVNVDLVRHTILDMKQQGKTVIFSTHVMEQAEQMCDGILLIDRGQKMLDGSLDEVKATGETVLHIEFDGDPTVFETIKGIERIRNTGRKAELLLDEAADPHRILRELMDRLTLRGFQIREPSLHEVFVRTVGRNPENEE